MKPAAVALLVAAAVGPPGPPPRRPPRDAPTPRSIDFGGVGWSVKASPSFGPGPNAWSDADACVRLGPDGRLRLAIARVGDAWACAEVVADRSLGYGDYRWEVEGDLGGLDPRAVLGLFLYESDDREVDFELSRWGDPADPENAQFVAQPASAESRRRFESGAARRLSVSIGWRPGSVRFRARVGEGPGAADLDWTYSGPKVPTPGRERARMNLWLMQGRPTPPGRAQSVVVRSFEFRKAP